MWNAAAILSHSAPINPALKFLQQSLLASQSKNNKEYFSNRGLNSHLPNFLLQIDF